MIGLGLLEGRLPVLADHDERGQEDRFQRHDQRRPRLGLDEQHPDSEYRDVEVNELHRPSECGNPVSDPQLKVGRSSCLLVQDNRVVPKCSLQLGLPVFQTGRPPAAACCMRFCLGPRAVWSLCALAGFAHRGAFRRCRARRPL